MKRQRLNRKRSSKFINLVELVRKRSRYHPYICSNRRSYIGPQLARLSSFNSRHQCLWNNRISSEASFRTTRSRAAEISKRRDATTIATEDRAIHASPTYSSVYTQYEPNEQASIPSELRRILEEESSDSNDNGIIANDLNSGEDPIPSNLDVPRTSGASCLCGDCIEFNLSNCDIYPLALQEEVVIEDENSSEPSEADEADEVDEAEEANEADEADEGDEAYEPVSSHHTPIRERSRESTTSQQPADEEAGGDGYHNNNSVVEIEITLTSSYGNHSDEEVTVAADDESEE